MRKEQLVADLCGITVGAVKIQGRGLSDWGKAT